jgi:hypothetical protein
MLYDIVSTFVDHHISVGQGRVGSYLDNPAYDTNSPLRAQNIVTTKRPF